MCMYAHIYIYVYVRVRMYVCVCVCVSERERECVCESMCISFIPGRSRVKKRSSLSRLWWKGR